MHGKLNRIAVGAALVVMGFAAGTLAAAAKKEIERTPAAELKYAPVPETPVQSAGPFKGAKGIECHFHKFPKGFAAPLHTHTADVMGVVLAGNFGSGEEGTPDKLQGPGSFQHIPGGLKHTSKCGPDADCTLFICQPGPFDLKPVAAPAAPEKAPKK